MPDPEPLDRRVHRNGIINRRRVVYGARVINRASSFAPGGPAGDQLPGVSQSPPLPVKLQVLVAARAQGSKVMQARRVRVSWVFRIGFEGSTLMLIPAEGLKSCGHHRWPKWNSQTQAALTDARRCVSSSGHCWNGAHYEPGAKSCLLNVCTKPLVLRNPARLPGSDRIIKGQNHENQLGHICLPLAYPAYRRRL